MIYPEIPLPRLIDQNGQTERYIRPISVDINQKIVPLSYASMTLPQDESVPGRSYVELFTSTGSAGIYRVTSPQEAFGEDLISCELEHSITEVGDWLYDGELSDMIPANEAIGRIFNAKYKGNKWQLGSTSALGTTKVAVEISYRNVLEGILGILDQVSDCMMTFDFSTTPWTFSFAKKGTTVQAEGRLSRNVTSAKITYDDSSLCTRAFYQYTDGEESHWETKDADTQSEYGIVERSVSTGSGYTKAEAEYVADRYLAKHKKPLISISIEGLELSSITGEPLDRFEIGKMFRLALPDYGISSVEDIITELSWKGLYSGFEQVTVNLGDQEDGVVNFLHDIDSSGGSSSGGRAGSSRSKQNSDFWTAINRNDYAIRLEAYAREEGDNWNYAYIELTASLIEAGVADEINGLYGYLEMTASRLATDFMDQINGLYGYLEMTASHFETDFEDRINGLYGYLEMTASHFETDFIDQINGLYGYLEMTASHFETKFMDQINGLYGYLEMTASHFETDFVDQINGLYGYLEMTASHFETDFTDQINGLYGYLEMTASHFETEFEDQKNQLYGYLEMTASHFETEFADQKNQLYGYVEATASHWESVLVDESASIRSLVRQTASSWDSRVEGVVDKDGNVTAASIGVAINDDKSNAFIDADHIHLTGSTLLSGHLTVEDGNLKVLTALSVGNTTGKIVTINAGKVNIPDTLQISSGAELLFVGSQTGERYSFSASNVGNILTDAAISNSTLSFSRKNGSAAVSVGVSGNSLVFTDSNGQSLSFSKATTLEGAWSGGSLTVNAYQTNNGTKTSVRQFVSTHELSLNGQGSSNFSVEMKTHDTGDATGALTVRDSKYIYLHENVNGVSSTVVAGENADGTSSVASISTAETYRAGVSKGKTDGHGEMGVEVDAQNSLIKVAQSSTKSLSIMIPNPTFSYNDSTHEYRVQMTAKAGDTVVATATSLNTSGLEAYNDGIDDCWDTVGIASIYNTTSLPSGETVAGQFTPGRYYRISPQAKKSDGQYHVNGVGWYYAPDTASGAYEQGKTDGYNLYHNSVHHMYVVGSPHVEVNSGLQFWTVSIRDVTGTELKKLNGNYDGDNSTGLIAVGRSLTYTPSSTEQTFTVNNFVNSVTVKAGEKHTKSYEFYCSKRTPLGGGQFDYVLEGTFGSDLCSKVGAKPTLWK